jgi:hypothetical protein
VSRDDDAAVYEIAYAEAVRALSEQFALVESIRSRAGLLLSAGAVTTSFLGAQALGRAGLGPFAWLALLGFCGASALCLVVLSQRSWALSSEPVDLISVQLGQNESVGGSSPQRLLARRMQNGFAENRERVERLGFLLQLASALFAADVVLWLCTIVLS